MFKYLTLLSVLGWSLSAFSAALSETAAEPVQPGAILKKSELEAEWQPDRRYRYVYSFARRWFHMNEADARAFAKRAIAEAPTQLKLYRYLEAYQFANASVEGGGLGLSADVSDRFAQQQEYFTSEDLYLYKKVYHEALSDSLLDANGKAHPLDAFQARMVAENIVHSPASDYARYHYVFSNLPVRSSSDFDSAMTLADSLGQANTEQYGQFRSAVNRASHRGVSMAQAFASARAQVPLVARSSYGQNDFQSVSSLPASAPVSGGEFFPATQSCPLSSQANSNLSGAVVLPGMNTALSAADMGIDSLDPNLPLKVRVDIYNAATAFGIPEKFLACTMKIESNGRPTVCSYKKDGETIAAGIMQIIGPTYQTITKLTQTTQGTNAYLGQDWAVYKSLQTDANNPVRQSSQSWPESCFDPSWSVGAGALLFRDYATQLFGPGTDPRSLTIDQLSMLAGSYNAGPAGLRRYCGDLNDVQGCLSNLKNSRSPNLETYNYILMMASCLQNSGPEVVQPPKKA
ncbi:MAG: transglycosylase SLT domain-containing protein [Oligoflexia bacterium]|nr:transglycosylase SLT domain-containing protein [Oligoflexia bacterium]